METNQTSGFIGLVIVLIRHKNVITIFKSHSIMLLKIPTKFVSFFTYLNIGSPEAGGCCMEGILK